MFRSATHPVTVPTGLTCSQCVEAASAAVWILSSITTDPLSARGRWRQCSGAHDWHQQGAAWTHAAHGRVDQAARWRARILAWEASTISWWLKETDVRSLFLTENNSDIQM